jgi:hypothetical protein
MLGHVIWFKLANFSEEIAASIIRAMIINSVSFSATSVSV